MEPYKKKLQKNQNRKGIYYFVGGLSLLGLHTLLKEDFISIVHNYELSQSSPDDWLFFYLLDYILIISAVCSLTIGIGAFIIPFLYKLRNQ